MEVTFHENEKRYIVKALEARLKEIGPNYTDETDQENEIAALRRVARQLGVDFESTGDKAMGLTFKQVKIAD
jgi:hypothetical protein